MNIIIAVYCFILIFSGLITIVSSNKIAKITLFFTIAGTLCALANGVIDRAKEKNGALHILTDDKKSLPDQLEIKGNDLYIDYIYEDTLDICDYPVGKYSFEDHPIAKLITEQALIKVKEFCDSCHIPANAVKINIVGTADGIATKGSTYLGDIGDDIMVHYLDNKASYQYIHLQKGVTVMTNMEYAACRAYPVKELCEKYFGDHNININTVLHCFKDVGPKYRKVAVSIKIKDFSNLLTREIDKYHLKHTLKHAKIKS